MAAMRFPCRLDAGLGRFRTLTEPEEIAQSVRMILSTRPGERPFRPKFGADLDQFAFEDIDTTAQTLIRQEVLGTLRMWEPRIGDIQISFAQRPDDGILEVNVSYTIHHGNLPGQVSVQVTTA